MTGKELINEVCRRIPDLSRLYNARVRHYIIKEHILNVYNEFEKYFSNRFVNIDIEEFRLFLVLHDIGKSIAYKHGNKDNQYSATIAKIEKHQTELDISDNALCWYIALLNTSSLGKYMEGKVSLEHTFTVILSESRKSKLSLNDFFYCSSVYYQCDVASYTKDAGGLPYLEHLFEYQNGSKVFNEKTNLLKFSELYEQRYDDLYKKVQEVSLDAFNEFKRKDAGSLSTQDINVQVLGKIDITKFQRKAKEIDETKRNLYVIDTNVFIDYPEIIEKINKEHGIILSAKVLDELDKLKSTLDSAGQRKVQKALRSINQQFDKREIKLETAELELLPKDFNPRSPDNFILSVLLKFPNDNPILLTSDHGLQIKAKGMGISTITLKEFLRRR